MRHLIRLVWCTVFTMIVNLSCYTGTISWMYIWFQQNHLFLQYGLRDDRKTMLDFVLALPCITLPYLSLFTSIIILIKVHWGYSYTAIQCHSKDVTLGKSPNHSECIIYNATQTLFWTIKPVVMMVWHHTSELYNYMYLQWPVSILWKQCKEQLYELLDHITGTSLFHSTMHHICLSHTCRSENQNAVS